MDNKKINKIAKKLIALEEENQEIDMNQVNREFFENTVKTQNFPNFTKSFDAQSDTLTYTFNDDEMQSCYIYFWEDGGIWNYSVYINNDVEVQVEKETCEEAFNDLVSKIHTYVEQFNDALEERTAEMQQINEAMGDFKVKRVNAGSLFKDYPVYSDNPETYAAFFKPYDVNKSQMYENLNRLADEMILNTSKKFIKSKNALVFQTVNQNDLKYAIETIESYGWVQE